jgi:hypothetical protein
MEGFGRLGYWRVLIDFAFKEGFVYVGVEGLGQGSVSVVQRSGFYLLACPQFVWFPDGWGGKVNHVQGICWCIVYVVYIV